MNINAKDFRVPEGKQGVIEKWATCVEPVYKSKKKCRKIP